MQTAKARLDALDGWRAIAVLLVILYHLITFSTLHSEVLGTRLMFAEFGSLGVDIFFVISGYVICSALMKEYENHGRISLRAFYIRRCFRILPPLWCYLAVVAMLSHAGFVRTPITQEVSAAAFVCNLPAAGCSDWQIQHTWSLAYEEQFYILFPITFLFVSPRRRHFFLECFLILPPLIVLCYLMHQKFVAEYLRTFQFLLAGIVMAFFSEEIKLYLRKLKPSLIYVFMLAILLVNYLTASAPVSGILKILVLAPLIGIVVFYTSHFPCAGKDVLSSPVIRFVGRISYGIYLWQQIATGPYDGAGARFYPIVGLGLVAVICVASFIWIEQPLIGLAARLSKAQIGRETADSPTATTTKQLG